MGIVVGPSSPEFCVVSLFVILLEKGFVHLLVFLLQQTMDYVSDDQKLKCLVSFTTSPPPSLDLDRG